MHIISRFCWMLRPCSPLAQGMPGTRFREWTALRHAPVTSIAELVRAISDPREGHYPAAPLQEAWRCSPVKLPPTLERLVDSLRRVVSNTATAEAASFAAGDRCDNAPARVEPQATTTASVAGPPAEPGDARSPHLALFHAEDNTAAERPAPALSAAITAESEDPAAAPTSVPAATSAQLDAVDLQAEFALRLPPVAERASLSAARHTASLYFLSSSFARGTFTRR